jgi:phosphoribosylformylglycinamidine synthase
MADAAKVLSIPVISGNVSLYNETNGEAIWPTPVVGVVGLLEDAERAVPSGFQQAGDLVLLAGAAPTERDLSGSALLSVRGGMVAGRPRIDLDAERRLHVFLAEAADAGLLRSAHDVSAGGVAVAVAECCIAGNVGAELRPPESVRADAGYFGEAQSCVVLSSAVADELALTDLAQRHGVPLGRAGVIGGDRLRFGAIDVPVSALRDAYESGMPRALEGVAANV